MAKQNNDCWRRIETVLKDVNMSTNYLAKHIGLLRGENLYQIKRGNNKISIDVARRINQKFPEYSIPWLMFGIDDVDGIPGVMRVPYYNSVWSIDCPMKKRPERELVISEMVANGAQVAAYFEGNDTMSEKYLQHTILFLRQITVDSIIFGRIYYVISSRIRLLCIVGEGSASDCLCLHDINSDSVKVEIQCDEIRAIWDLCGVYKHFGNR